MQAAQPNGSSSLIKNCESSNLKKALQGIEAYLELAPSSLPTDLAASQIQKRELYVETKNGSMSDDATVLRHHRRQPWPITSASIKC